MNQIATFSRDATAPAALDPAGEHDPLQPVPNPLPRLLSGEDLPASAFLGVGDTPRDVDAGHGAGIRVAGVATGEYSVEELTAAGADWALATLEDGLPRV